MTFKELDKNEVVQQAQIFFLNDFPLEEIDNKNIRTICKNYRNNNGSFDNCKILFEKHFNYFYNWAYNNWMMDVFYFRK